MKYLIIKLTSLGDVVHSFSALDILKQETPVQIHYLVDEEFSHLVKLSKSADVIHSIPLRKLKRQTKSPIAALNLIKQTANELKKYNFDAIIDLQGLWKSASLGFFSKTNDNFYGYNSASCRDMFAPMLYAKKLSVSKELHAKERMEQLVLKTLDIDMPKHVQNNLTTQCDFADIGWAELQGSRYALLLHGTTWKTKEWLANSWLDLSRFFSAHNITPVVLWGNEHEKNFCHSLKEQESSIVYPNEKLSFAKLTALIKNCACFVSVDTGLGHLASAYGMTGVGLFGPTSAKKVGFNNEKQISIQSNYEKSPCYKKKCNNASCCMANISVDEVIASLISLGVVHE